MDTIFLVVLGLFAFIGVCTGLTGTIFGFISTVAALVGSYFLIGTVEGAGFPQIVAGTLNKVIIYVVILIVALIALAIVRGIFRAFMRRFRLLNGIDKALGLIVWAAIVWVVFGVLYALGTEATAVGNYVGNLVAGLGIPGTEAIGGGIAGFLGNFNSKILNDLYVFNPIGEMVLRMIIPA